MSSCCEPDSTKLNSGEEVAATCPGSSAVHDDACCAPKARVDWLLWCSLIMVLAALVYRLLSGHGHQSPVDQFAHAISELFLRMWWGLALGIFFVGLLSTVPRDLVMSLLGRDAGVAGLLRATSAGVLLDMCSHGILAIGMKLYERGASTGQVIAFLLASPWNSFSLTLILFGLIGVGWTLLFIALSLLIGLLSGAIFDALVARGHLPENPFRSAVAETETSIRELWSDYRRSWRFSRKGMQAVVSEGLAGSRVVLRWALFGLVLAGLIRSLVPAESYASWFGPSMIGLWLTLLAATVIEVCSEGATPIAADLMNRAAAPGNSFTFLMAGVATDYTEILSIKDTSASWRVALCLPLVAVPQVLIIGFLLNSFSP
ncbi:MAG: permease [Pseudomonadota bacterium]